MSRLQLGIHAAWVKPMQSIELCPAKGNSAAICQEASEESCSLCLSHLLKMAGCPKRSSLCIPVRIFSVVMLGRKAVLRNHMLDRDMVHHEYEYQAIVHSAEVFKWIFRPARAVYVTAHVRDCKPT